MSSAAIVGKLQAVLGLDAREFTGGMDQAKKDLGGFGVNSQTAFKVAGAAAAVGFGLMTKGALEMESAQGKFQAATGASREEAVAFSKDMNSIVGTSKTVGASFEEIAATGTMVAQQFGTTGQATADLTADILGFSKVTGQDATAAADKLDTVLTGFGLSAEDASGFMDQLVTSSQKYGTDAGPETLDILGKMAPALTTMGMGLDDGVELLNAFEEAEVDAASAQKGLQAAIKKLEPGQNLDDLITQIGAIEDPTLRAQKAIEIFGTKAGVGLAKVIQPGMTSLDEFGVSADEAAGSVDQAADDMLTTTDRFKMFAEKVGGFFREGGQMFGPLLSGLAGLSTLIGGQLAGSWDKIKDSAVVKNAIAKAGLIVGPIYSGAMKIGELVGSALSAAWDLAKSAGSKAIAIAGGLAGAAYAGAVKVGEALGGVLSGAWTALGKPGSSVLAAARTAGLATGGAFTLGVGGGLVLLGGVVAGELIQRTTNAIREEIRNNPKAITPEDLFQMRAPAWAASKLRVAQEMQGISAKALNAFNAEWDRGISGGALASVELVEKARQAGLAVGDAAGEGAVEGVLDTRDEIGAALIEAATSHAGDAGAAAAATMLTYFTDYNLPENIAQYLADRAYVAKDGAIKMMSTADEALKTFAVEMGDAIGNGVPENIAAQWAANGQPLSDAVYAMLHGINIDGSEALIGLYEKLNVPQQLAIQWATTGPFDLQKAIDQVFGPTGDTIDKALRDSIIASAVNEGLISPDVQRSWLVNAEVAARSAGAAVPPAFGDAMLGNASALTEDANKLKQMLMDALDPEVSRTEALGKEYLKLVRQGMEDGRPEVVKQARQVALDAIAAIAQTGTNGDDGLGHKGLKRVGQYFAELVDGGLTGPQALALIESSGTKLSAETIAGIKSKYPDFFTAGAGAADEVHDGIDKKPWETWGSGAAGTWVSGFVNGISHKQDFIERKLENLFKTNSPPKVAPHIDDHGIKTGELWGLSVLKGGMAALSSGFNSVFAPTLTPAFTPTLAAPPVGLNTATAPISSGPASVTFIINDATDPQRVGNVVLDMLGEVFPIARPRVRHTASA